MFWKNKEKKEKNKQYSDIIHDLALTKSALDTAYSNFENVVNPDLIDCYIYEVNAVQKRYKFLLELAREMEAEA
ncbi:MAG: YaaL family protein [Lachnospiraceae bacterium]|nr:YaaL family protein [Lachnospiraceae bacterium]